MISVSIHAFNVTSQDSNNTVVETIFLLQNPTKMELKVAYIKQEVYRDPRHKNLLGETHLSGWQTPSHKYIIQIPPFSNGTVAVNTSLENFSLESSSFNLFLIVYMRFEEIPLISSSTLKWYFALSS